MLRSATIDEFERDPVGSHVAGRSYVIWVDSPTLAGSAYFGKPEEREFAELLRLSRLAGHPALAPGFDALIDCRELESVDALAFATLTRHLDDVAAFASKVGAVSLVRPVGVAGAITAGLFFETIRPTFRAALFSDVTEAFAWLGRDDAGAARGRLDALMARIRDVPTPLRAVRDHLAASPQGTTLALTARALGVSERSLSRRLSELGTTFRAEVQRARLRSAEALLAESDLKLELVARRVGFASRAHFNEFFQRATGETPRQFRERRRPAG